MAVSVCYLCDGLVTCPECILSLALAQLGLASAALLIPKLDKPIRK